MKRYLLVTLFAATLIALATPALVHGGMGYTPMIASQRFVWQDPLPQGNPLKYVDFVTDTLGWAIGDNGTVLKTTDGGFTWANQGPIVTQGGEMYVDQAMDIDMIDASIGYIAIGPHVYKTTNGGSTWAQTSAWTVSPGGSYYLYQAVDFSDANNGWMIGSYNMFHTTNGGSTVTSQSLPGGYAPYAVRAASSAEAVAWNYSADEGYLRTSDGGATWEIRHFPGTAYELTAPWFMAAPSGSTLYATVGTDVLKTTNGGSTWTTVTPAGLDAGDTPWQLETVDGATSGLVVYLTTDYSALYRTADGGATWDKMSGGRSFQDLDAPSGTGLFGTVNSRVVGSDSSGSSFYNCDYRRTTDTFSSVDFTSETTGYALCAGMLAQTGNGGTSWTFRDKATLGINLNQMGKITFLDSDPQLGWIIGSPVAPGNPTVYRTYNAGQTWEAQEETTLAGAATVRFADASNGIAAGDNYRRYWRTTDGGNTWTCVTCDGVPRDIDFVGAKGWMPFEPTSGGDLCVWYTTDSGSTWTTQTVGHTGAGVRAVDFVDADTGYLVDTMAHMFKTTNGGTTWTEVELWPYAPDFSIDDVTFSTPLDGWIIGQQQSVTRSYRHDFAAHTTDGGETWDFYDDSTAADNGSTGTNVGLMAVEAVGDRAWAVGGYGAIIATRPKPVADISSKTTTLSAYDQSAVVTGTLVSDTGTPLSGRPVELWSSALTSGFTKSTLTATTTADGTFTFSVKPRTHTYYKVKSTSFGVDAASNLSGFVRVLAAPYVSNPVAPSTMYRNRKYTVYGSLKPKHALYTKVKIFKYRKLSTGKWKSYGYTYAKVTKVTYTSTSSKYSVSMSLPYTGKWRLRAYHIADSGQVAKYSSSYDYVTVR